MLLCIMRTSAVSLVKNTVKFDQPLYVGFPVQEAGKTLLYDYHYNVMKKHYNESIALIQVGYLIFVDIKIIIIYISIIIISDTLVYHVKTDNLYTDLLTRSKLFYDEVCSLKLCRKQGNKIRHLMF